MPDLPITTLGRTGLRVTKLGYGTMELSNMPSPTGPRAVTPVEAGIVLHAVLDAGINFIDTSPCYGDAEEAIGEHLSGRRDEFLLASKCGCPVGAPFPGPAPHEHTYTRENIRAGVEQSLRRMKTDYLDLVKIHNGPPRAVLEGNDSVAELLALQREGKIRFIGMSSTLPNLTGHIAMGVFDAFQFPYSALEREHEGALTTIAEAGAGTVIRSGAARRIVAAPDALLERADEVRRPAMQARRDRLEQAALDDLLDGASRMEFLMRFVLSNPDVHTTVVGTANPAHVADNAAAAAKGPLPADVYGEAKLRFA